MFFYTTSKKNPYVLNNLKLSKLAENMQWLEQAAIWAEDKWGFLRNPRLGLEGRKKQIEDKLKQHDNFYILTYAEQPIGMFALHDYPSQVNKTDKIKELMAVYIDASFRDLGIGRHMLNEVKRVAAEEQVDTIVLETLNPALNKFYQKSGGATVVCDSQFLGHPASLLRM